MAKKILAYVITDLNIVKWNNSNYMELSFEYILAATRLLN